MPAESAAETATWNHDRKQMDLNLLPVDDDFDEEIHRISTMGSFHIPINQVRSEENSGRRSEALGMVLDYITQIMSQGSNPHRALKQFQKLNPLVFEGIVDPLQAEK